METSGCCSAAGNKMPVGSQASTEKLRMLAAQPDFTQAPLPSSRKCVLSWPWAPQDSKILPFQTKTDQYFWPRMTGSGPEAVTNLVLHSTSSVFSTFWALQSPFLTGDFLTVLQRNPTSWKFPGATGFILALPNNNIHTANYFNFGLKNPQVDSTITSEVLFRPRDRQRERLNSLRHCFYWVSSSARMAPNGNSPYWEELTSPWE